MSGLFGLAWRNLWRGRRRTLIALAAGALGLMFAQAHTNFLHGTSGRTIDEAVRSGPGHLTLRARGSGAALEASLPFRPGDLASRLGGIPHVAAVLPRLLVPGQARSAHGSRSVVVLGIDPAAEWAANPFAAALREGRLGRPDSPDEAVVGRGLFERLRLRVGGRLVVLAQGSSGEIRSRLLRVAGVLATGRGPLDDGAVFVDLAAAQDLAGCQGAVGELAVQLDDARRLPAVLGAVREAAASLPGVEVLTWRQTLPELASHTAVDRVLARLLAGLIYFLVGVGIVNALLMSVVERSRELGVMRALGASPGLLVRLVVAEGLLMGLLAVAAGSLLGTAFSFALVRRGLDVGFLLPDPGVDAGGAFSRTVLHAAWNVPAMAALALAAGLLFGAAAAYPAWRAAHVRPVEAMRGPWGEA